MIDKTRIPQDKFIQMYTTMVRIRQFEDRVYLLFEDRKKQLGEF